MLCHLLIFYIYVKIVILCCILSMVLSSVKGKKIMHDSLMS